MNMAERTYDVIVYGATGFTGRLVAEHMLAMYRVGESTRWANRCAAHRVPSPLLRSNDPVGPSRQVRDKRRSRGATRYDASSNSTADSRLC